MTERNDALRAALAQIGDTWSAARTERGLAGIRQRLRRARARQLAAACALCAVAAAAVLAWWRPDTDDSRLVATRPSAATGPRHMQFEDGSRLELLDANARIVIDEVTPRRVALQLLGGSVDVDVVPRKERAFRVQCGAVAVEVLGTAFALVREAERTHVSVRRGRVAVHWPAGSMQLSAGEAGWFPKPPPELSPLTALPLEPTRSTGALETRARDDSPLMASPHDLAPRSGVPEPRARDDSPLMASPPDLAPSTGVPEPRARDNPPLTASTPEPTRSAGASEPGARDNPPPRRAHGRVPAHAGQAHDASWQAQAERGEWTRAYDLMEQSHELVSDDVQELLLAADAARLSGHPAQAVLFLRRVAEQHPRDPRASLAAFTLGGVLLHQLDKPREAEAAYARARSLALSPALAQDALARQVEAAQRAGDSARMRALAREYLRRYPEGRRVQWVRQLSAP